jgi:hypothetical protein
MVRRGLDFNPPRPLRGLAPPPKPSPHTRSGGCAAVAPGSFRAEESYYPRVLNAQIHPTVATFLGLGNARIAARYAHLHPAVSADALLAALSYRPRWFRWAGADTFCVTDGTGRKAALVVEVNSSPSGCKSIPLSSDADEQGAYRRLVERTFMPMLADPPPALRPPAAAGVGASGGSCGGPLARRDSDAESAASGSASTVVTAAAAAASAGVPSSAASVSSCGSSALSVTGADDEVAAMGGSAAATVVVAPSSSPSVAAAAAAAAVPTAPLPPAPATTAAAAAATPGAPYAVHPAGVLAVVYDKNAMEAGAYAAAIADAAGEVVYLAEFYATDPDPPVRFDADRRMLVRSPGPAGGGARDAAAATWLPVRGALKYVTQRPWSRIPLTCATPLLNPVLPCLAGGRNKAVAARAYAAFNAELAARGRVRRRCCGCRREEGEEEGCRR